MIAALYVATGGSYYGLPGVEPWDETRDARLYQGPWPVVAHPPCQRWGKMWFGQPLTVKLTGVRKVKGDDGGCFKAALDAVRAYGGVLEHPWGSHAWAHFGLNLPRREGGWIAADYLGGWTCCVEQGRYGHYARKPTLLYSVGCELPDLDWGIGESRLDQAVIERMGPEAGEEARRGRREGRRHGQQAAHRHAGQVPRSAAVCRQNCRPCLGGRVMGILTNEIPDGYITGLGRDDPHPKISHLYKGDYADPGRPMCLKGWNRNGHTSYSIWRGNMGEDGVCKVCLRRARAGLDGKAPR